MKRIYLFLVAFLICVSSSAQVWDNSKPDKRFTFGIRAGINILTSERNDYIDYHAGLNADINIIKSFAVETGLFWSEKEYYDGKESDKDSYFKLPILAMGRLFLSENTHLQVKGGLYVESCIGNGEYQDAGIILGIGCNYKRFYLGCQYEREFGSFYNDDSKYLAISIGYDF